MCIPITCLSQEPPPKLLLIVQERLKPDSEHAYARVEQEIARTCARLKCPHAYLALESVTGAEVWWLNAFTSQADKERVERAYACNETLMAALRKLNQRKAALTNRPVSIVTRYRADLSRDNTWTVSGARFFVVTVTNDERKSDRSVFEASDGRQFLIATAGTRSEAEHIAALAGAHTTLFAVRPSWSLPADAWTAAEPEFWLRTPSTPSGPPQPTSAERTRELRR
jgi:hypothetical protein